MSSTISLRTVQNSKALLLLPFPFTGKQLTVSKIKLVRTFVYKHQQCMYSKMRIHG